MSGVSKELADLLLYEVPSGRLLDTRPIPGGINGGRFTADGALLVLSGDSCNTLLECRD